MGDCSQETDMTVVLRWQPNRESDDPRLIMQLEDGEGREWDPGTDAALLTGFMPVGWPRGSALTFKRTIKES
jgi:hypothetical protein